MRNLLRAVFVCITLFGAIVVISAPSRAASGAWVVVCGYTRSLPDDPIVHPKAPGTSHLHDFLGNTSVDAFSTMHSMQAAGSTCPAGDLAGYWVPALFRNGTKINPSGQNVRQQVYYTADNLAPRTHIEPFPPDMRLVAGNAMATSPRDNWGLGEEIYWGCSDNSVDGKPITPPSSCRTGILSLHVGFPNCWDGVLTHDNDTSHLRYPSGGKCPAGFSHALPRVILRTEYPVGTATGNITLASGQPFTAHGDFWNTWDQAKLKNLVDNCLNADKDCGVFRGSSRGVTGAASSPQVTQAGATTQRHQTATTAPSVASSSSHSHQHAGATTAAAPATAAASTTSAGSALAALSADTASSGGGSRLPGTGTPLTAAAALAVGLLGLGATTLLRTRVPRPRPKH
jgi:Domain of unknown function (DUF1996)